ncbi:MAG: hypothetical protein M1818_007770 [Claussenomyces sp. TS43310]|nr:MAG: hypothetical protein M1818_007770 [Claussenomyces sp. TS43310]
MDEREAQRRRDLNLENQRKRAALEEERRQEQQRLEAEKRRDKQRGQAEASKNAQRQILERAKLERPPPPAVRPLTGNNSEYHMAQDKPLPPAPPHRGDLGAPRPPRMNSTIHRPVDDNGRMGNPSGQNMAKAPLKRPLPLDTSDEASRPALQRNGPSYAGKRRRTEEQNVEVAEAPPRPAMAPPVRQSAVRPPKDGPSKSIFASGYANVPQASHGAPTLLQQATRPQQGHQQKPAHPMDMTHNSKATINFAPNTAQASGPHKTPARPVVTANGKSTAKASTKSSPHYQNGDSIDLPEINTDSEDEDSDAGGNDFAVPDWANSPNLAPGLIAQEGVDPVSVFGRPGELRMEEVFRNKERWGRFRQRTSSANWSGSDRLTEEEVRRDLEARERLRREGGWSYGLS